MFFLDISSFGSERELIQKKRRTKIFQFNLRSNSIFFTLTEDKERSELLRLGFLLKSDFNGCSFPQDRMEKQQWIFFSHGNYQTTTI